MLPSAPHGYSRVSAVRASEIGPVSRQSQGLGTSGTRRSHLSTPITTLLTTLPPADNLLTSASLTCASLGYSRPLSVTCCPMNTPSAFKRRFDHYVLVQTILYSNLCLTRAATSHFCPSCVTRLSNATLFAAVSTTVTALTHVERVVSEAIKCRRRLSLSVTHATVTQSDEQIQDLSCGPPIYLILAIVAVLTTVRNDIDVGHGPPQDGHVFPIISSLNLIRATPRCTSLLTNGRRKPRIQTTGVERLRTRLRLLCIKGVTSRYVFSSARDLRRPHTLYKLRLPFARLSPEQTSLFRPLQRISRLM
ncbi:hypothetical protein M8818_003307 [Zalaria obscura]|uniref:Uncharacterized protein n=1 Tax=Zalaria obscura TaxID=2024903 RepID=A0ACC3SGN9_9PEZI